MKLQDFIGKNFKYDQKAIAANDELSRQIQQRLIDLNLLAPPVDGVFGPVSAFALQQFQILLKCGETDYLGALTAKKLIEAKRSDVPALPAIVKTLRNTFFKTRPLDSTELTNAEKQAIPGNSQFELIAYQLERQHIRIILLKDAFNGIKVWYAYGPHVTITQNGIQVYPKIRPKTVKLQVPYLSQLDNYYSPTGTCNVTSLAMCFLYLGIPQKDDQNDFPDELYLYALDHNLSRHEPLDLAKIVTAYGARDNFTKIATIEDVQNWLAGGNPAVVHGYFTAYGHVIVLIGYDEDGFFVNDPYGEWFADGYDNSSSGAGLHYSYNLIRRVCIPDGNFWVHFISK